MKLHESKIASRLVRLLPAAVVVASALGPPAAWAGNGLINVNQHQTLEDGTCNQTLGWNWNSCSYNETLPFPTIAAQGGSIGAFSFHVRSWDPLGLDQPLRGMFCQAVCHYEFATRPKIISSDFGPASLTTVDRWLETVCNDATRSGGDYRGRLHYEHWESSLSHEAEDLGHCFGGFDDWPDDAKDVINLYDDSGRNCASSLEPNGVLYHPVGTNKLKWSKTGGSDDRVTLVGFGFMGALAMGDRLNLDEYLRDLRWKRANLTRVWAVEQWTAQAGSTCTSQVEGPTPFEGSLAGRYHLNTSNPYFYSRLRELAQGAADRGIVLQLAGFDKHGLLYYEQASCSTGDFDFSPYNEDNNDDLQNRFSSGGNCTCNSPGDRTEVPLACVPPSAFVLASSNDLHFPYLSRVGREVGAIGNVIFEVINEARSSDWGSVQQWQLDMAKHLERSLPTSVVRDAFNQYAGGNLALKTPDARQNGSDSWTAINATIAYETEFRTNLKMGHVEPTGAGAMSGSIPFAAPAVWTDLGVRASLTAASGYLNLGVATTQSNQVYITIDSDTGGILLYKIGGGGGELAQYLLASTTLPMADLEHTIRLRILKDAQGNLATEVLVDGEIYPQLSTSVGALSGVVSRAMFSSGPEHTALPEVDNFEAAFFCDSPTLCGESSGGI